MRVAQELQGLFFGTDAHAAVEPSQLIYVLVASMASALAVALVTLLCRKRNEAPIEAGPLPIVGGIIEFLRVRGSHSDDAIEMKIWCCRELFFGQGMRLQKYP